MQLWYRRLSPDNVNGPFKRAEGALYKEKLVELYPEKIVLKKNKK